VGDFAVSVVVPTRDRAGMLEDLLDSLGEQSFDASRFEVIVVNDASADGTAGVLNRMAERASFALRIVDGVGRGPAAARNLGWREASAPLIAFTDDDCVVTPAWLDELVDAADGDETIVQGRTDLAPGDAEKVGPFSRVLQITEPGPFFATCNVLYPRPLLERLGGFDEEFLTGEDTDLGWRAQETGAGYHFATAALVNHAVVDLGPIGKLRWVFRWSHAMRNLSSHPSLRDSLTWGIFWKRTHALLAVALLGVLLSRRFWPALLLTLPYGRALRARCIIEGYSLGYVPYLALYDLAEMTAAARGAVRYRVLVL
jgi:glycosyltransferase involved in cell wall biosynthesis